MKKVKVSFFILLLVFASFGTLLWAQDIDENIAGIIACYELGRQEYTDEDPVTCSHFTYTDPSFQCPDGGTRVCYGCKCMFDSGAVIRTTACECHF